MRHQHFINGLQRQKLLGCLSTVSFIFEFEFSNSDFEVIFLT